MGTVDPGPARLADTPSELTTAGLAPRDHAVIWVAATGVEADERVQFGKTDKTPVAMPLPLLLAQLLLGSRSSADRSTSLGDLTAGFYSLRQVPHGIGALLAADAIETGHGMAPAALKVWRRAANARRDAAQARAEGNERGARYRERMAAELERDALGMARAGRDLREGGRQSLIRNAERIAHWGAKAGAIPMNPAAAEVMAAETFGRGLLIWLTDPIDATRSIVFRSAPQSALPVAGGIVGFGVGGPKGAAVGAFAGGAVVEFGASAAQMIQEAAEEDGVSLTDPDAIVAWVEANPDKVEEIAIDAAIRAGIIGAFDAGTAGASGLLVKSAAKTGANPANAIWAGVALDAMGGGAGEMTASLATEGDYVAGEVFAEMVGGAGPGAVTTGGQQAVQSFQDTQNSQAGDASLGKEAGKDSATSEPAAVAATRLSNVTVMLQEGPNGAQPVFFLNGRRDGPTSTALTVEGHTVEVSALVDASGADAYEISIDGALLGVVTVAAGQAEHLLDIPGVAAALGVSCFVEGTLVWTEHGNRPIEEVKVGDRVWSLPDQMDDTTSSSTPPEQPELRQVLRVKSTRHQETLRIIVRSTRGVEDTLGITGNHRMYTQGRGWVPAGMLALGDTLQGPNHEPLKVVSMQSWSRRDTVYNLTVDGFHTYFAGRHKAWTHNTYNNGHSEGEEENGSIVNLAYDEFDQIGEFGLGPWTGPEVSVSLEIPKGDFNIRHGFHHDGIDYPVLVHSSGMIMLLAADGKVGTVVPQPVRQAFNIWANANGAVLGRLGIGTMYLNIIGSAARALDLSENQPEESRGASPAEVRMRLNELHEFPPESPYRRTDQPQSVTWRNRTWQSTHVFVYQGRQYPALLAARPGGGRDFIVFPGEYGEMSLAAQKAASGTKNQFRDWMAGTAEGVFTLANPNSFGTYWTTPEHPFWSYEDDKERLSRDFFDPAFHYEGDGNQVKPWPKDVAHKPADIFFPFDGTFSATHAFYPEPDSQPYPVLIRDGVAMLWSRNNGTDGLISDIARSAFFGWARNHAVELGQANVGVALVASDGSLQEMELGALQPDDGRGRSYDDIRRQRMAQLTLPEPFEMGEVSEVQWRQQPRVTNRVLVLQRGGQTYRLPVLISMLRDSNNNYKVELVVFPPEGSSMPPALERTIANAIQRQAAMLAERSVIGHFIVRDGRTLVDYQLSPKHPLFPLADDRDGVEQAVFGDLSPPTAPPQDSAQQTERRLPNIGDAKRWPADTPAPELALDLPFEGRFTATHYLDVDGVRYPLLVRDGLAVFMDESAPSHVTHAFFQWAYGNVDLLGILGIGSVQAMRRGASPQEGDLTNQQPVNGKGASMPEIAGRSEVNVQHLARDLGEGFIRAPKNVARTEVRWRGAAISPQLALQWKVDGQVRGMFGVAAVPGPKGGIELVVFPATDRPMTDQAKRAILDSIVMVSPEPAKITAVVLLEQPGKLKGFKRYGAHDFVGDEPTPEHEALVFGGPEPDPDWAPLSPVSAADLSLEAWPQPESGLDERRVVGSTEVRLTDGAGETWARWDSNEPLVSLSLEGDFVPPGAVEVGGKYYFPRFGYRAADGVLYPVVFATNQGKLQAVLASPAGGEVPYRVRDEVAEQVSKPEVTALLERLGVNEFDSRIGMTLVDRGALVNRARPDIQNTMWRGVNVNVTHDLTLNGNRYAVFTYERPDGGADLVVAPQSGVLDLDDLNHWVDQEQEFLIRAGVDSYYFLSGDRQVEDWGVLARSSPLDRTGLDQADVTALVFPDPEPDVDPGPLAPVGGPTDPDPDLSRATLNSTTSDGRNPSPPAEPQDPGELEAAGQTNPDAADPKDDLRKPFEKGALQLVAEGEGAPFRIDYPFHADAAQTHWFDAELGDGTSLRLPVVAHDGVLFLLPPDGNSEIPRQTLDAFELWLVESVDLLESQGIGSAYFVRDGDGTFVEVTTGGAQGARDRGAEDLLPVGVGSSFVRRPTGVRWPAVTWRGQALVPTHGVRVGTDLYPAFVHRRNGTNELVVLSPHGREPLTPDSPQLAQIDAAIEGLDSDAYPTGTALVLGGPQRVVYLRSRPGSEFDGLEEFGEDGLIEAARLIWGDDAVANNGTNTQDDRGVSADDAMLDQAMAADELAQQELERILAIGADPVQTLPRPDGYDRGSPSRLLIGMIGSGGRNIGGALARLDGPGASQEAAGRQRQQELDVLLSQVEGFGDLLPDLIAQIEEALAGARQMEDRGTVMMAAADLLEPLAHRLSAIEAERNALTEELRQLAQEATKVTDPAEGRPLLDQGRQIADRIQALYQELNDLVEGDFGLVLTDPPQISRGVTGGWRGQGPMPDPDTENDAIADTDADPAAGRAELEGEQPSLADRMTATAVQDMIRRFVQGLLSTEIAYLRWELADLEARARNGHEQLRAFLAAMRSGNEGPKVRTIIEAYFPRGIPAERLPGESHYVEPYSPDALRHKLTVQALQMLWERQDTHEHAALLVELATSIAAGTETLDPGAMPKFDRQSPVIAAIAGFTPGRGLAGTEGDQNVPNEKDVVSKSVAAWRADPGFEEARVEVHNTINQLLAFLDMPWEFSFGTQPPKEIDPAEGSPDYRRGGGFGQHAIYPRLWDETQPILDQIRPTALLRGPFGPVVSQEPSMDPDQPRDGRAWLLPQGPKLIAQILLIGAAAEGSNPPKTVAQLLGEHEMPNGPQDKHRFYAELYANGIPLVDEPDLAGIFGANGLPDGADGADIAAAADMHLRQLEGLPLYEDLSAVAARYRIYFDGRRIHIGLISDGSSATLNSAGSASYP